MNNQLSLEQDAEAVQILTNEKSKAFIQFVGTCLQTLKKTGLSFWSAGLSKILPKENND